MFAPPNFEQMEVRVSGKKIGEACREIAGDQAWRMRPAWPPDIFAFTSALLADSGAYRLLLSPHTDASEHQWPPALGRGGGSGGRAGGVNVVPHLSCPICACLMYVFFCWGRSLFKSPLLP